MASVPKFWPLTVIVNGTLFTGTLFGVNAVMEGEEKPKALRAPFIPFGSREPLPHPIVRALTRTTRLPSRLPKTRISTSLPRERRVTSQETHLSCCAEEQVAFHSVRAAFEKDLSCTGALSEGNQSAFSCVKTATNFLYCEGILRNVSVLR